VNTRHIKSILVALSASLVAACATTSEPVRAPVNIEIQEAVGFTITEEARIGGDVRTDYETAVSYLEQGRQAEGIALLEQVAAAAPDLSAPRIDLGIAQHRAGDLEAAEKNLLLALESNPGQPVAHNELGIIYRKTGRFAEARRSYEAALAVYPGFHFARRNLAILCDLYLADLDCALDNYEAYMKTVPGDEEASMWIADLRYRLDQ
jgi:Flp pilus assembly protein TadD